jgi:hypothetical protein
VPIELTTNEHRRMARAEGRRYCKVHGPQDLNAYTATSLDNGKVSYHCKTCTSNSRRSNSKRVNTWTKANTQKHRLDVLGHYSPGLCCAICGEDHLEFLALDHIHGCGRKERSPSSGGSYWRSIKRVGYPEGYRVLCHNCNHKHGCRDFYWKGGRRKADSELSQHHLTRAVRRFTARHPDRVREQAQKSHRKRKAEVMAHYGGRCACCKTDDLDVLSIDHVNKDGAAHRRFR